MTTPVLEIASKPVPLEAPRDALPGRALIFFEWCLRREAFTSWTYVVLLMPLIVAAGAGLFELSSPWYPEKGRALFRTLAGVSLTMIFVGAVRHASRAVCWEISNELRELVRLTGIGATTLLWCQTISRWWTILLSVGLILPLVMYARSLGGVTSDQWIAAGCWIVLLAFLSASSAMIASVSSTHASNADTTAAAATFWVMAGYHLLFWGLGLAIWIVFWMFGGRWNLPPGSLGREMAMFSFSFAPLIQIYRAIQVPEAFSPYSPAYWVHFLTGAYGMRLATIVMRNRFRAETVSSSGPATVVDSPAGATSPALQRPRCSDRPFFWKEIWILGGGGISQTWWKMMTALATVGILSAALYEISLPFAGLAIAIAPWVVALKFDGLMAAEFRERTWDSLMLLPIDPREPILAKIYAAGWERRWIIVPVVISVVIIAGTDMFAAVIAVTIITLMQCLLFEISVLSHFNKKVWWAGVMVAIGVISLIAVVVAIWVIFARPLSFGMTIGLMSATIAGLYSHIHWRLQNWTEA